MSEEAQKARRMTKWQWYIFLATAVFSSITIGLAFANQGFLAQLSIIPVVICFIASCVLAWQRYQFNKVRREAIVSQLDAERDAQLIELFDSARRDRNLPPDAQSRDGYSAAVREAKAREEAARQGKSNLPPGVKRRGGDGSGRP